MKFVENALHNRSEPTEGATFHKANMCPPYRCAADEHGVDEDHRARCRYEFASPCAPQTPTRVLLSGEDFNTLAPCAWSSRSPRPPRSPKGLEGDIHPLWQALYKLDETVQRHLSLRKKTKQGCETDRERHHGVHALTVGCSITSETGTAAVCTRPCPLPPRGADPKQSLTRRS